MPKFAHVVRAAPDRVWKVLTHPPLRRLHGSWLVEAALERGAPGQVGSVAAYRTKRARWREVLVEAEPPGRVLYELKDRADRVLGAMEWRLAPVNVGTHVVLDVKGRSLKDALINRYVKTWFYRRLVRTVKLACEGPPTSVLGGPAQEDVPPPAEPEAGAAVETAPRASPEPAEEPAQKAKRPKASKKARHR